MRTWAVALVLVAASARAQPVCSLQGYSPSSDGGWVGPVMAVACDLALVPGAVQVLEEFRLSSGTYGGAGSLSKVAGTYERLGLPFQDGALYAWRATALYADGGVASAPSAEAFAIADVQDPTPPAGPVDLTLSNQDGGAFTLSTAAWTDDGGGALYTSYYALASNPVVTVVGINGSWSSAIDDDLGPGTWQPYMDVMDVANNFGATVQSSVQVVVTADPSVFVPTAPTVVPMQPNTDFVVTVNEPADTWHFLLLWPDGGLSAGMLGRVVAGGVGPLSVWGFVGQECSYRLLASRVVGGRASDWSPPSAPFQVDLFPPSDPSAVTAGAQSGGVQVAWAPSTDSCSGVHHYLVERALADAGAWQVLGQPASAQWTDVPAAAGDYAYRVTAFDDAGWSSLAVGTGPVRWPPVDGGAAADAGSTDAGSDGGSDGGALADGGLPGPTALSLTLGCGCEGSGGAFGVLALSALSAWRHRRRG